MPTVFISYAREDQAFVRALKDGLTPRGIDAWIDWEGIPPSADYFEEIQKAIDRADAVLVVLSPDLAASRVCSQELAHAVAAQKRLIPILRRSTPSESLDSALRRLNWIHFRESDDQTAALAAVVTAVETDLEWVSLHTRLLVRALEWEQRGHDSSLLLRGQPLRDAEEWLAESDPGKDPQPTHGQRQFLLASRRAATNRQRQVIGASILAVVVSLALAVLALIQRQNAIDQRAIAVAQKTEAQTEAALARSRELAAVSVSTLATDPELSIRLAMNALDVAPTHEAETALRQALGSSHVRATLRGDAWFISVLYSPDGTMLYACDTGGRVRAWNASSGAVAWTSAPAKGSLVALALSPDGGTVASAGADGVVRLFDAKSGRETDLSGVSDVVWSVAFSPGGRLLASSSRDGAVRIWDVASRALVSEMNASHGSLGSVAFSPRGDLLAAGALDGSALLWSVANHRLLRTMVPANRPPETYAGAYEVNHVRFSPDGGSLLTASYDGSARLWDTANGDMTLEMQNNALLGTLRPYVSDALFSSDGSLVATGSSDGVVRLWDAKTGQREADLRGLLDAVTSVAFSPDGRLVAAASFDGSARVWDVVTQTTAAQLSGHDGLVESVAFDPNGERVATASRDDTVRVWESATGSIAKTFGAASQQGMTAGFTQDGRVLVVSMRGTAVTYDAATGVAESGKATFNPGRFATWWIGSISPDGGRIAVSDLATNHVVIWSTATGIQTAELSGHSASVLGVAWSPDERLVASASADDTARIWDAQTGKTRFVLAHSHIVETVAFTPDGRALATAGDDGVIRLWDVGTGALVKEMKPDAAAIVDCLAFNSDGTRLVAGSSDNVVRVWDTATGRTVNELRGHTNTITAVAFDVGGKQVISGDATGEVRVWDADSGQTLAVMRTDADQIRSLAVSATGNGILILAATGPARLASCDVCGSVSELLTIAKERGTRELTPEERRHYLEAAASPAASRAESPVAMPAADPPTASGAE